uniref:Uncharacterized protein n=1 Tax=Noctiluca scintillans TaxID=2966 RepID=A0A7S1A7R1_NOCSC
MEDSSPMMGLLPRSTRTRELNVVVTYFSWKAVHELPVNGPKPHRMTMPRLKVNSGSTVFDPKRRLPPPEPLEVPWDDVEHDTCFVDLLMRNKVTDWARARRAATKIRDKDYTLKHFHDDCVAAFPELRLYVLDVGGGTGGATTSGRSPDDEYQRTMGALFAIYWLMRLQSDGAQAFCHGVGSDWCALSEQSEWPQRDPAEVLQREGFLLGCTWSSFENVLKLSGLLDSNGDHDHDRTLAMLALTAIHDIMKNQDLLPNVPSHMRSFRGFASGDTISDHDVALAYLLENVPTSLPSFFGLPPEQRESVKFTQSKMEFNMGWLVQAEAPPSALFSKFRAVITSGTATSRDIAFYFVHWLTDLAGAEPFPLEGCEKFVLKFPQHVLQTFLDSIPQIRQLDTHTETEVFESYLCWRWSSHLPPLGTLPEGRGSIARLRLVAMAQHNSVHVVHGYTSISEDDQHVLAEEMALSGFPDQTYAREPRYSKQGPSFLVYYGPAFLQKNAATDPKFSLEVLAELYRQARVLWPASPDKAHRTVTLRIDALKELDIESLNKLNPGEFWVIHRTSMTDGQVKRSDMLTCDTAKMSVLNLSRCRTSLASLPQLRSFSHEFESQFREVANDDDDAFNSHPFRIGCRPLVACCTVKSLRL